jgi:hypothetical protein
MGLGAVAAAEEGNTASAPLVGLGRPVSKEWSGPAGKGEKAGRRG